MSMVGSTRDGRGIACHHAEIGIVLAEAYHVDSSMTICLCKCSSLSLPFCLFACPCVAFHLETTFRSALQHGWQGLAREGMVAGLATGHPRCLSIGVMADANIMVATGHAVGGYPCAVGAVGGRYRNCFTEHCVCIQLFGQHRHR